MTLEQFDADSVEDGAWADISVPVTLEELAGATVLWLNRRWFIRRGFDIGQPQTVKAIEDWLLDRFAYIIRESAHDSAHFTGRTRVALVDRYGGRGIGNSGGSGRCAFMDGYYSKGVGPTPLRDSSGPFFHIHGALTLEEALRETVLSEVACAEFPCGAVPTIAILSMQPRLYQGGADPRGEPRALMIRPAFKRVGHLEPSTLFISKICPEQAGADAERVVAALKEWCGDESAAPPLVDLADRLGKQLAFGRVHRLSHGSFVSSNLSQAGELADFGSFRAVPTWEAAHTVRGMPPFGQELPMVSRTILWEIAFQIQRLKAVLPSGSGRNTAGSAITALQTAFNTTIEAETLRLFGLSATDPAAGEIVDLCNQYFSLQNRVVRDYYDPAQRDAPSEWLHSCVSGVTMEHDLSTELGRHSALLKQALYKTAAPEHARATARRMLLPRAGITREVLQAWAYTLVFNPPAWLRENLRPAIAQRIAESRRVWPEIDSVKETLLGQALDENGSSALWARDAMFPGFVRLTMRFVDGRGCVFGQDILEGVLSKYESARSGAGVVTVDIPTPDGYDGTTPLTVAGTDFIVPPMSITYVGAECAEVS